MTMIMTMIKSKSRSVSSKETAHLPLILLVLAVCSVMLALPSVDAFVHPSTFSARTNPQQQPVLVTLNNHYPTTLTLQQQTPTTLFGSNDSDAPKDFSGSGRGVPLLLMALAASLWFFTIPPDFRRTHICTTDRCVADRAFCSDCRTISEFRDDIATYYKNGGGVQWDFSIDPESKAF